MALRRGAGNQRSKQVALGITKRQVPSTSPEQAESHAGVQRGFDHRGAC